MRNREFAYFLALIAIAHLGCSARKAAFAADGFRAVFAQMAGILRSLLTNHQVTEEPALQTFLAETLLHLSPQGMGGYDRAAHLILRMIES